MPSLKYIDSGSSTTLVTGAQLDGAADGGIVLGSAIDNATDGYQFAKIHGTFKFAGNATTGGQVDCWFITSLDGTNYEDASTTVAKARNPDFHFIIDGITGSPHTQVLQARRQPFDPFILLPPGSFKILTRLNGTGSALASDTASSIVMRPFRLGTT